ncbi:MAG: VTT domain-containing protein [Panacagrimonas sp.]
MLEHAQSLLAWIGTHPGESLVLLFLVSMLDAIFIVGAFVPAAVVLFAMGALVALGSLELWPTALIAAAGALAGDALSFALGRRYGERLFQSRLLLRYPDLVAGGRRFFARHGGKGVMLARFLGPVRSITPALAGASRMSWLLFLAADFVAALLWALVFLVPGVVFGASLGLAAEVATRLAGLLVLNIALLLFGIWAARAAIGLFNTRAERWVRDLLEWSRRHRRLGRFGPGLADPAQPETPALIAVGALLLAAGGIWLVSFGGVGWRDFPGPLDGLVHQTLSDLSTPWGTAVARFIARLGEWPVYGSTAAAVLAVLLWRRRLRAAAHWVSALLFGVIVTAVLSFAPLLAPPATFFAHGGPAPPRDLALVTIVYGCAATLFATLRPTRVRQFAYSSATAVVLLIGLARLVLAQEWASFNTFAIVMGLLWTAALTLGYRQHGPERLFAGSFALPVLSAFAVAVGMSWGVDRAASHAATATPPALPRTVPVGVWWETGWRDLPATRIDVRGRSGRAFDLQWAAAEAQVESELLAAGWKPLAPLNLADSLRWLTETGSIAALPVLPQVHAGSHARVTFRRPIDETRQQLIRLWDSGTRVEAQGERVPVWLGTVTEQRARTYYRLFRYPVSEIEAPPLPPLFASTANTALRAVERQGHRVWLMGAPRVLYTSPIPEAAVGPPVPLPP